MKNKPASGLLVIATASLVAASQAPASGSTKTGFAITDLSRIQTGAVTLAGQSFTTKKEQKRMTFACLSCEAITAVDVLIDKSNDGTEARLRSEETKVQAIERTCRTREPECRIAKIERHGAVGWVSKTRALGTAASTAVLFKNGDRLIIRSIAPDTAAAYQNGAAILDQFGKQIIG